MKKNWQLKFGIILVLSSAILYLLHLFIFKDSHHILVYLLGDIAFVPIEVLLVTMIIHKILEIKEKKEKMEKLNMLVGVFYSEVGKGLIKYLSEHDSENTKITEQFCIKQNWCEVEFSSLTKFITNHESSISLENIDLTVLQNMIYQKRDFIISMLQNPMLLEHDNFTNLVKILFHIDEEFSARFESSAHLDEYKEHLEFDIQKAYKALMLEWVDHMQYLKENFPNLFAFSIDTNPFVDITNK